MAADDAAVTVTLRANIKDYEAALKNAVRATERAATAAEKAISNVGKGRSSGGMSAINDNFAKSAGQIANDARMLQFQLNDIFSGIASGQGIRAVQMQLGQIAQQLSGGGMALGARTLGTALIGMVNPINLAVVAFGALATVAASYFLDSEDGADKTEKKIKAQRDLIRDVAKQWGDALPALKAYNDELERQEGIQQQIKAGQAVQAQVAEDIRAVFSDIGMGRVEDAFSAFERFPKYAEDIAAWKKEWEGVQTALEDGNLSIERYNKFQQMTNSLLQDLPMSALESLQALWLKSQETLENYVKTLQASVEETNRLKDVSVQATDAINRMVPFAAPLSPTTSGAGVFNPSQTQMDNAKKAREEADQAAKEAARAAERAAEDNKREAERAAVEAAEQLNKAIANQTKVAVDAVTGLLGKSETANAAEINSFLKRGGVDIDAATTAWCAAFVNSALAQVGIEGSGSNVATSFANWGQGVDLGKIQRGDVLVESRGRKAGQTGGHVGFATGNIQMIGEEIAKVEMISGNASDKVTTEWVDASDVIARRASEAFVMTGDSLNHLGEQATAAAASTKQAAADIAALNQQMAGIIGGALSGFISDLIAGEDAGDAFANMLQRITSQLIDMMVQMLIIKPLMSALGGGMGGGGILGFEGGGTVGLSGHPAGKRPAALWANAPRYAQGGMVGLKPGEVPIIAHRGEIIVPNAKRLAGTGAGRGGVQNYYSMDNSPISISMEGSGYAASNTASAKQFGENIQKLIQAELVRESRPGGLLRKVPH